MKIWRAVAYIVVLCAPFFAAACNTVEGAGRDVQGAGRAVERTADDLKP